MQASRPMRSPAKLAGLLGIVLFALAPAAHSDLIPSPYLPLTPAELAAYNGFIGGTADCSTEGNYDATSFDLDLSGECASTTLVEGASTYPDVSIQAMLDAVVDNSGELLAGGGFSLFGIIPDLGINNLSLLASGTVFDVEYGSSPVGRQMQTLIELDFLIDPLSHLGDFLYWGSNIQISGWATSLEWQSSADPSDFSNFTGSQYFFYDQDVIVAAPDTLAMFSLGLAIIGLAMRRGRRIG